MLPDITSKVPRNTGFPEPLSRDRNTTLPHPDADQSPNACITQEDANSKKPLRAQAYFWEINMKEGLIWGIPMLIYPTLASHKINYGVARSLHLSSLNLKALYIEANPTPVV